MVPYESYLKELRHLLGAERSTQPRINRHNSRLGSRDFSRFRKQASRAKIPPRYLWELCAPPLPNCACRIHTSYSYGI
ncbi:hypothetical protein TWF281_006536 [Arthrobotrys megalospora]